MFSLQATLGRDDEFCALFEACAREGHNIVRVLNDLLSKGVESPALDAFAAARRKEKELNRRIEDLLIRAFVVSIEREDIEALASALYRIPKTVEKFAERYLISAARIRGVDFSRQVKLMERATECVVRMIQAWRAGATLKEIKQINASIQKIESDADDVILELTGKLYVRGFAPLKAIIAKDLLELNEKVVDRCRDAGNVITRVVLKNS